MPRWIDRVCGWIETGAVFVGQLIVTCVQAFVEAFVYVVTFEWLEDIFD